MEVQSQLEGIGRKVSLLSMDSIPMKSLPADKQKEELAPPDRFYLTHVIFFFFALGSAVSYTFFFTAQDYWMYKFRDVNYADYDLKNKTLLQQNFATISGMSHTIPAIISSLLASYYGHKLNIYSRMIVCLSALLVVFLIFAAFIYVNTDPWQITFFVITIVVSSGITVSMSLLSVTHLTMISRFPPIYLKTQMYGTASSSIIGALLQIFCLYLGSGSHQRTAIIYFSCGSLILGISVACAVLCKRIPRFNYYVGDAVADTKKSNLTLAEIKNVAKGLWPNLVIIVGGIVTAGMAPVTLFVPENYGHGDLWSDRYFTPVISFLWVDVLGLVGRYLSGPYLTPKNAIWFVLIECTRLTFFHPLLLFCNILPRKHFPVLFNHDWEYITILTVDSFFGTFFGCCAFMSIKNMLGDKAEQGFLFMAMMFSISGVFYSILSTFWVNII